MGTVPISPLAMAKEVPRRDAPERRTWGHIAGAKQLRLRDAAPARYVSPRRAEETDLIRAPREDRPVSSRAPNTYLPATAPIRSSDSRNLSSSPDSAEIFGSSRSIRIRLVPSNSDNVRPTFWSTPEWTLRAPLKV